ncbi:MAG: hypothetical protein IPG90_19330 [Bacteroidetes bacterium]|nr:hypothetical protein [Bacteroidota bacterium]MBP6402989.1 hypothetical protein [Bacteroidia bacterium]MBK6840168.1 hypothetical protein [Bacteroidota bacterium]MBK9524648.1 hypothetical protein [Bacteroidota bacterium]MBK9542007.1 hypothetical protein [Bacteroidota bacterium]
MKFLRILPLFFLFSASLQAQKLTSEELFKEYFTSQSDSLDPIEGIWTVSTTQEFYNYDTLYDIQKFPKAAKVAVMKKENKYESFNLTGDSYDVQFSITDVKGVYLYRNFFRETNEYSKTSAVISKAGEMEYTYEFPDDFLRVKFADSYEEGTRVVNILKWTKVFPEPKKK